MSTSEVTAYLAGVDLARAHPDELAAGQSVVMAGDDPIPAGVVDARVALGDRAFVYWVQRGIVDTLNAQ